MCFIPGCSVVIPGCILFFVAHMLFQVVEILFHVIYILFWVVSGMRAFIRADPNGKFWNNYCAPAGAFVVAAGGVAR